MNGESDLSAEVSVVPADHQHADQTDVLRFALVGWEDGHAQRQLLEGADGGRQAVDAFFHQLLARVVVVEAVQPRFGQFGHAQLERVRVETGIEHVDVEVHTLLCVGHVDVMGEGLVVQVRPG